MALQVKKWLVDRSVAHVPQSSLQLLLFAHLAAHGGGERALRRYTRVSRFFARRAPLAVLIAGPPCSLKTTLAQACLCIVTCVQLLCMTP